MSNYSHMGNNLKIACCAASLGLITACATNTEVNMVQDNQSYLVNSNPTVSNWSLIRMTKGTAVYTIARSNNHENYIWISCKVEQNNQTELAVGIAQPDSIARSGTSASLIFMVDGREVIHGEGKMVSDRYAVLTTTDPRRIKGISQIEQDKLTDMYLNNFEKYEQDKLLSQMSNGDYVIAEILLHRTRRDITVDLIGFNDSFAFVAEACNRS